MHASTISSALISHLSLTHSSYLTAFLISTKSHKGKSAVMIRYWNFTLLYFGLSFFQACSFTAQEHIFQRHCHSTKSVGDSFLLARRRKSNDQEDNNNEVKKIPQLPPVTAGGCSSQNNAQSQAAALAASDKQATPAFVSPKFQLQYTCNVCETRNCHLVSRIAYTEGVVIGICKGCKSKHLIADNLGTAGLDGDTNIENYFKARGMEDNVNRVTQEVFELEKILGFDSIGGALAGEDGTPVLE